MDEDNINSWISEPDVCRCCLSASGTRDLTATYATEAGIKEIFSDMLQECYGISLYLPEWVPSRKVCELCVGHLQDASSFKKQVQDAERYFVEYVSKKDCVEMEIKIEHELENGADDLAEELKESESSETDCIEMKMKIEPELENNADDFAEEMKESKTDTSSPRKVLLKSKQKKSANRKRHKQLRAKGKTRTEDSGDSDTPLTLLSKNNQNVDTDNIDNYNLDNNDLGCKAFDEKLDNPKKKASKTARKRKTTRKLIRADPETYTENSHLRSNITLVLKHSTILPFKHIDKVKYTCLYCDTSYLFIEELKSHVNEKHRNVSEKEIFKKLINPKYLIKAEVSDTRCKLCDDSFKKLEDLVEHLVKKHNKVYHSLPKFNPSHGILGFELVSDKYRCCICKKEFQIFKNLSIHMNEHNANFVCQYCGKNFLSNHRLQAHVKSHTKSEKSHKKCKICDKEFHSNSARTYHLQKVHRKFSIKCPECNEVFPEYEKRMRHLVDAHNFKKPEYICHICEKRFLSSKGHKNHVRYSHLNNTDYACEICGQKFKYKWTLKSHLVVHSGEKRFECKFCSKMFARPDTLRVHLRIHLNEKPYSCTICNAAFVQNVSLRNHRRVHHPEAETDLKNI